MKPFGINPNSEIRVRVDAQIRDALQLALEAESMSVEEAVFILTRILPELADAPIVVGHIVAAYKMAASRHQAPVLTFHDLESIMPCETSNSPALSQ